MKKILEITEEVEKHLIAVFDAALKSGGMNLLPSIDRIRSLIVQQQDPGQK
jgi:hypothetical protein